MADDPLDSLDPMDRSCLLVGKFLLRWSFMEAQLRKAIGNALGLSRLQAAVTCANISLRDKINILKTIVNMTPSFSPDRARDYTKMLDNLSTYSAMRNMVAHDMFGPSDDGKGVSFYVVKAKGKFDLPDISWDRKRCDEEYATIDGYRNELSSLAGELSHDKLLAALLRTEEPGLVPNLGLFGLGLPGLLNHPPPEPPNSSENASNPGKGPQTPEEPRG